MPPLFCPYFQLYTFVDWAQPYKTLRTVAADNNSLEPNAHASEV